jgi:hypothetical protein
MEKRTNQVSTDVASNRLSELRIESTNILIAPSLPVLIQIPHSPAAAQIFPFSKICSFIPFILPCTRFALYGHSTASQPYIRVRVIILSHEFGMFVLPASPWLASLLFVVLALFDYLSYNFDPGFLRLLPYALHSP